MSVTLSFLFSWKFSFSFIFIHSSALFSLNKAIHFLFLNGNCLILACKWKNSNNTHFYFLLCRFHLRQKMHNNSCAHAKHLHALILFSVYFLLWRFRLILKMTWDNWFQISWDFVIHSYSHWVDQECQHFDVHRLSFINEFLVLNLCNIVVISSCGNKPFTRTHTKYRRNLTAMRDTYQTNKSVFDMKLRNKSRRWIKINNNDDKN